MNACFIRCMESMKHFTFCTLLFISFSGHSQQWEQVEVFQGNHRDDGTVFKIGDKAYCGLGMNSWFGCNNDFFVFDISAGSWSQGIGMPAGEERQYANGFSHGGAGYVFGGINPAGDYLNDLWMFDPQTGIWSAKASLPAPGRAGAVCFIIGDTAYIAGGKTAVDIASKELWALDLLSGTWSQKGNLPFNGIWRGVGLSWNGSGVIGLGKNNSSGLNDFFYRYNPGQDAWELLNGITVEGASYTASAQIGSMAYLYGGMNAAGEYLNTFYKLDLVTSAWTVLNSFPAAPRRGAMAFTGDNAFYLTTGVSAVSRLDETWRAASVLSLNDNEQQESEVRVFPNPSHGTLKVSTTAIIRKISISDIQGKIISSLDCNVQELSFDPGLARGLYLFEIYTDSGLSVIRQMVE